MVNLVFFIFKKIFMKAICLQSHSWLSSRHVMFQHRECEPPSTSVLTSLPLSTSLAPCCFSSPILLPLPCTLFLSFSFLFSGAKGDLGTPHEHFKPLSSSSNSSKPLFLPKISNMWQALRPGVAESLLTGSVPPVSGCTCWREDSVSLTEMLLSQNSSFTPSHRHNWAPILSHTKLQANCNLWHLHTVCWVPGTPPRDALQNPTLCGAADGNKLNAWALVDVPGKPHNKKIRECWKQ